MNKILQEAIVGAPVSVTLGGKCYPLAYPVQAVILYQSETAAIDRRRRKESGGKRLDRAEVKELRHRRRELVREAETFRPRQGEEWTPEAFESSEALMEEALAIKCALDEDAAIGDSLYDLFNWRKINPERDPERFLAALWVGLHQFERTDYRPQLSREEIGPLLHPGNVSELTFAISQALSSQIIGPQGEADQLPNVRPPAVPAETKPAMIPIPDLPLPEIPPEIVPSP